VITDWSLQPDENGSRRRGHCGFLFLWDDIAVAFMKTNFQFDPVEAVKHLRNSDEVLAGAIDRVGRFELELRPIKSLFEAMLRSITYQQLHGNAAAAIYGRVLVELAKHGGENPETLMKTSDAALRGAGLSANKLLAARALAQKCLDGVVPSLKEAQKLEDAELIRRLTEVRGIGPWTVHMLLIFYLGRADVLPTGDFSVRQAFKRLYKKRKDPTAEAMIKHARRWQPYRSVASWYLWRSLDHD
jgi:DNA-3-methyladenine glycosylase II